MAETRKQKNARLVRETRESGKAFLRKTPGAFGGGINPETGVRSSGGQRVSVLSEAEKRAGVSGPTLEQARAISQTTATKASTAATTRAAIIKNQRIRQELTRIQQRRVPPSRLIPRTQIGKQFTQTQRFKGKERSEEKILQQSIIPIPSIKKIKTGTIELVDLISGGSLTEREIDKKQEQVNKDVENFNKEFGGRSLSEAQFKQSEKISKALSEREESITKARDNLAKSSRSKVGALLFGFDKARITSGEREKIIKQNKPKVEKQKELLKKTEQNIAKVSKQKGVVSKLNLNRLNNKKEGIKEEISRLKEGRGSKVFAGEFPIIPAVNIPSGVSLIKFIGTQKKAKGGKIITDIVFQTNKGRIGVAKGVSVAKGKKGASVVLGRTGKRVFKFPSGKQKIIKLESFIGREKTLTVPGKIVLQKNIKLLQGAKSKGTVITIKKNLNILKQAGIGQVGSVKGTKLMKGGKAVKGITRDNFASISAVLTKKQLSLIVGKSITEIGVKSQFIGIIKGTSKAAGKTFTVAQKQQFQKGLQKVISATAGALAKADRTGSLPRATVLATASRLAVATAKTTPKKAIPRRGPTLKQKPIQKPKVIPKPQAKQITKQKPRITSRGKSRSRSAQAQKPKTKQTQKTSQKAKQKPKTKQTQKTSQKSRARQAQKTRPATVQKQKAILKAPRSPRVPTVPRVPRSPRIPKIKLRTIGRKGVTSKRRRQQAYKVMARPIKRRKGQKKPKLVKVNKVPLKKSDARGLRNYIADTSLARSARASKTKGKPQTPRLKVPKGYAKRTKKKFRTYKTVKGKRVPLPKGGVIEKRRNLLDTIQEKKKITLRRRIKQITPKRTPVRRPTKKSSPKKITRRNPVRTQRRRPQNTGAKRQQMLKNLAKGRRVLAAKRRR